MPNWEDFQRKHVLDPSVDGDCTQWGTAQWNNWLRNRLPHEFSSRRVNSVVVCAPNVLISDFQNTGYSYSKPDFYWSNNRYRIFALTLDHNLQPNCPYRVYDFGKMFILVKISRNPNVPIHFEAQNTSPISSGKANICFSDYSPISK